MLLLMTKVAVIEECLVDRTKPSLIWYTRNIGLTPFMATVERVTITPSESSSLLSKLLKECWIDSSIFGFRSAIKKFGVDRYKKNCGPATEGFNMDIGFSCNLDINVGFSCNLSVDIGFSFDFFMNICYSRDIFVNIGDSFDICVVVFLSSDIFMNVGNGGGVNLTSIIVGVDNVVDNRGRGISGNVSVSCRGSGISSMVSGESCIGTSIASIS